MPRQLAHELAVLAALAAFSLPSMVFAQDAEEPAELEVRTRDITFGDDLRSEDIALVGINAYGSLSFGVPDSWDVQGTPELHLSLVRSAQLIPEVSAITVWADGRPVGTVSLDGEPGAVDKAVIPLPLSSDTGYHTVTFLGYHRSRLPCELSDHPGLWSRVLNDSFVRVNYAPSPPELDLAAWPRPFRDDRDPDASRIVLVVPEQLSAEEAKTAGYLASTLGHEAGWRPLDLYVHRGSPATAPAGHLIAIARMDQPSKTLSLVKEALTRSPDPELNRAASAISGKAGRAGIIALAPRPDDPERAMLVVLGRDGNGLTELAHLLATAESRNLPTGKVAFIDQMKGPPPMAERVWDRTVPPDAGFLLSDLGFEDRMATGYRGGRVTIPMSMIPDDHPVAGQARLELKYSYSAQADTENSRIDVFLNGAAAGGAALRDVNGRNRQTLLLELPVHEMGPESTLDVVFTLVDTEEHRCLGDNRVEMWGTVHSDTKLTLPRDRWSYVPDLSLLRYGGYPFGIRPDYSETTFLLRADPSRTELQLFAWLAAEFGRVGRGDRFAYDVKMGSLEKVKDEDRDVVLIDSGKDGDLIQKLGLLDKMSFTPKAAPGIGIALAGGGMIALGADPNVAYIEQVSLPWNERRVGLVAYARDATLFERVGRCLDGDSLFDSFRGKLSRIASCADVAEIPAQERRLLGAKPMRESAYEPIRNNYWLLVAGILIGVILLLAIFGIVRSLGRQREYDDLSDYDEV